MNESEYNFESEKRKLTELGGGVFGFVLRRSAVEYWLKVLRQTLSIIPEGKPLNLEVRYDSQLNVYQIQTFELCHESGKTSIGEPICIPAAIFKLGMSKLKAVSGHIPSLSDFDLEIKPGVPGIKDQDINDDSYQLEIKAADECQKTLKIVYVPWAIHDKRLDEENKPQGITQYISFTLRRIFKTLL